jgi:hypothetical protein
MRYIVEWPGNKTFSEENLQQLRSEGASISVLPSAESLALPNTRTLTERELTQIMEASRLEESSSSTSVFKRIRNKLGGS